jgi:hypothetical protein
LLHIRIFLLFISIATFSFAQEQDRGMMWATNGLKSNPVLVEKFIIPEEVPGRNVLVLEVPFAKPEFISPLLAAVAKGKLIEKVQLVYTTFAVSPSFDQQKLNQQRLKNLHAILPDAFANQLTEWELVGQTGAHSPEEGKKYFHGFVIIWRPNASTELIKTELRMLDSLFLPSFRVGDHTDITSSGADSSVVKIKEVIMPNGKKLVLDHDIPEDSLWQYIKASDGSSSIIDAKYGNKEHTKIIVTELHENGYRTKHTWELEEHKGKPRTAFEPLDTNFYDSVFTTVMRRNPFKNMVLVCDVTGSMSPYTAQIFNWIPTGIASGKCTSYVFYNDGNKKSTGEKNIGKTGGIYGIQSQRFDSVFLTARETMQNGDGGDLPENPVEATLWAINHYSPAGDVVLVADNYSTPRDLELFKKINRPIHIILCGAVVGINGDYLFLARQTHGSVHTMTDDVYGLDKMAEGDVVKIGTRHYQLHNEKFICLEMFSNVVR